MNRKQLIDYFETVSNPNGRAITVADINLIPDILAALRGPEWVRTADRLPTVNDARYDGTVLIANKSHRYGLRYWSYLEDEIEICPYWMPLPKLPEVDNAE